MSLFGDLLLSEKEYDYSITENSPFFIRKGESGNELEEEWNHHCNVFFDRNDNNGIC